MSEDNTNTKARSLLGALTTVNEATDESQVYLFILLFTRSIYPQETTLYELGENLGLTPSAMSRAVRMLSDHGPRGSKGKALIQIRHDERDTKRQLISLSPKGYALVTKALHNL